MWIDFDVMESETIRPVLRVLGDDARGFWRLRHLRPAQCVALCSIRQSVETHTEQRGDVTYRYVGEMRCGAMARPAFDGQLVCPTHEAYHQPCTTCGQYAATHPDETRCYRCIAAAARRRFLVGPVPQRFQWRRVKGARTPVHAVDVTRHSHWGNPFKIVHQRRLLPKHYRQKYRNPHLAEVAVRLFEAYYEHNAAFRWDVAFGLAGRDLKCFCPLDWPCHADVLLRWANAPQGGHA